MVGKRKRKFSTRAVHAGEHADLIGFKPVASPIYPTIGYTYESMDETDAVLGAEKPGYVYTRYGSPTVAAFEAAVADLEGAEAAHAYSSGMAAIHAALLAAGVQSGVNVIAAYDVYGATYSLLGSFFSQMGAKTFLLDANEIGMVESALAETHPAALITETISNPLLKVADIPTLAKLAHHHRASLIIDNTFASPYLYNPIADGADYVVHSATKYLGGHGDVMAGVICTSAENRQTLYNLNKLIGGVLGPFEAWLALRGLKTLPLRIKQQCANALEIARWLEEHPRIEKVNYPGLESHPQHELAVRMFGDKGFGGVLSFEIKDAGKAGAFRFMEKLKLVQAATTLGDVYTLALHPATASHRSLTPEARERIGIRDGLVRLSAGIEDVDDILEDLEQALKE